MGRSLAPRIVAAEADRFLMVIISHLYLGKIHGELMAGESMDNNGESMDNNG